MTDPNTPPAASERMTAEKLIDDLERHAAWAVKNADAAEVWERESDKRKWTAADTLYGRAATMIRTLTARAEAAEARAETARDLALKACRKAMRDCFDEEFESLQEGLMTDADITDKEREAMRWQLNALDVWREDMPDRAELYAIAALTAPPPTAKEG